jgi:ParB-like chromosome segregation protein Spo0J
MEEVPCIELAGLSDTQRRAYIIADNKLALNGGWDDELLALELGELHAADFDMALLGFDGAEIAGLQVPDFAPATEDEQGKLDELEPKWIACPHCGKEFDAREHGKG